MLHIPGLGGFELFPGVSRCVQHRRLFTTKILISAQHLVKERGFVWGWYVVGLHYGVIKTLTRIMGLASFTFKIPPPQICSLLISGVYMWVLRVLLPPEGTSLSTTCSSSRRLAEGSGAASVQDCRLCMDKDRGDFL